MGYYFSVLMSGAVKIPGGEYKKETSLELEIPDMPEMPKCEEVLEIPENIEMEPETPGTEAVKEIKPEEIEQEMKEIEAEGGITGTEILESAERVLEGERVEAVTEAENVLNVGFEAAEEAVEAVNDVEAKLLDNNISELSAKAIKHPINDHMPLKYAKQLKYINRESAEQYLSYKTFFNSTWSEEVVKNALNYGYKSALTNKITSGEYTFIYLGDEVIVFLEDGVFKTGYGKYTFTYEELINMIGV